MQNKILEFTEKINHNKKVVIYVLLGIVFAVLAAHYFLGGGGSDDVPIEDTGAAAEKEESQDSKANYIIIEVAGAVKNPTIAELPEGSRIFEAIEAAGGLSADADTSVINKAAFLQDGERVYIPTTAEVLEGYEQSTGSSSAAGSSGGSAGMSNGKVNINTADSTALQTLNGVGPAIAERIITHRDQNGRFSKPEDLMDVSGIGEKTFAKLKDFISV